MESVSQEHERLEKSANLGKSIKDVDYIIDELKEVRAAVEAGMSAEPWIRSGTIGADIGPKAAS